MTMTRAEVERICKEARDAGEFPYLSGLDLSGLDLRLVDLTGADLSLVDLSLVDLWGSNMSGANMSGANLCDTNLCDTNLTGVDLSGSDLSDARLIGADMSGAVIRGTNLSGTFQSRGSIVLSLTGLPSGPATCWPTPDGWAGRIGCMEIDVDGLQALIDGDNWPGAYGYEQAQRRPGLQAWIDMCRDHITRNPDVVPYLQALYRRGELT